MKVTDINKHRVGVKKGQLANPLSEVDFINSMYPKDLNGIDHAKGIDMEALTFDAIVWLILVPSVGIGIVYMLAYLIIRARG